MRAATERLAKMNADYVAHALGQAIKESGADVEQLVKESQTDGAAGAALVALSTVLKRSRARCIRSRLTDNLNLTGIVGSLTPAPGSESELTAQGQPRSRFRRAIERRNLMGAETAAREMGVVGLDEALDLVVLVAEVEPVRLDRLRAAVACAACGRAPAHVGGA